MLKVFHNGDLHLGLKHTSRNYPEELRRALEESRFKTLERMVETANQEGCRLFLVAGDLFHNHNVAKDAVLKAVEIFSGFEGDCVAVLPGNHDFYSDVSQLWKTFLEKAPEQVLLLHEEKPYPLDGFGLDAVLYPAPCDRKHCAENRLGWINEVTDRPAGRWHLGVAHGTVKGVSADLDGRYYPMERDELLGLGLDHWFLGHVHIPYPEAEVGQNIGFSFCGTPEPDGFDCRHHGTAAIVELDGENVTVRRLPTGAYRFLDSRLVIRSLEEAGAFIENVGGERVLVKLAVSGMLDRSQYRERGAYFRALAGQVAWLELSDEQLGVEVTRETIGEEFPAGSFPELFLSSLAEGGSPEALQLAYQLIKKVKK